MPISKLRTPSDEKPAVHALSIDAARYLSVSKVQTVTDHWHIDVVDRAFQPRIDDLQADWVATVAAPAFKLIRQLLGPIQAFASIGTGTGLDALTAIELLGATVVGVTDLYSDVTEAAARNIIRNINPNAKVAVHAGNGDLLSPLKDKGLKFDVIYENLPNIPLADSANLEVSRTSSSFVPSRQEHIPQFAVDWMLSLHYVALLQAREFLNSRGFIISTLGGRTPLDALAQLAEAADLKHSFLTYTWKVQAEAEAVITSYAEEQQKGLGPFYFYPAGILEDIFSGIGLEDSGRNAFAIEKRLLPYRLDAVRTVEAFRRGERIGHTVVVLKTEQE